MNETTEYLFLNNSNWQSRPDVSIIKEGGYNNSDTDDGLPIISYDGDFWKYASFSTWYFNDDNGRWVGRPVGTYIHSEFVRFEKINPPK